MQRVTLGPPTAADIPAIHAELQDRSVSRWLSAVPWPYTRDDAEAFVHRIATPQDLAIRVNGVLAGMIRTGPELGYWVAPAWQGRGVGLRAGVLALSRWFDGGADAAVAQVMAGNDRSARLLGRLGFAEAGPTEVVRPTGERMPGLSFTLARDRFAALHPPRITTARTLMGVPTPAELPALRAIATQPEVARMLFVFHHAMTEAEFAATHPTLVAGRRFRLAVRMAGRVIGSIGVGAGPRPPVYYCLDPAVAGQGIASEILPAFIAEIEDRYAPEALVAEAFDDNPASMRVLVKAGFRPSGPMQCVSAGRGTTAPAQGFVRG